MKIHAKLLIYCGNGFAFNEIFRPIIHSLPRTWRLEVFLADYYLAQHTRDSVKKLQAEGRITSTQVIQPYLGEGQGTFRHHQTISRILKSLEKRPSFDLLVLGSDFYLFDRYLINKLKSRGAKIVVIQTGVLQQVLEEYRKRRKLKESPNQLPYLDKALRKLQNSPGLINKFKIVFRSLSKRLKISLRLWADLVLNHYLWPLLFAKTVFPKSRYEPLGFTIGLADAVICYDELEIQALQEVIPQIRNVCLTAHPSADLCRCQIDAHPKTKLYVLLAGPIEEEMEEAVLLRWVKLIKAAANYLPIRIVHLRFHPRTKPSLKWPQQIQKSLKAELLGCELAVIDSMQVSLPESICDYAAVIGAMSGALRTARAACQTIPVIGLPNMSTDYDGGDEWLLGNTEGINLITENKELNRSHLTSPKFSFKNRPRVAQILTNL